jgi:uncharacterized protein YciI
MNFHNLPAIRTLILALLMSSGTSILCGQSQQRDDEGFEIFNYQDEDTTFVMKKYFIAFLKAGPNRSQDEAESARIQAAHLSHMATLAKEGKICITGPFGDGGEIRGMVVYNVKTQEEAASLAKSDPAVVAGRLEIEIHPWWARKGAQLF